MSGRKEKSENVVVVSKKDGKERKKETTKESLSRNSFEEEIRSSKMSEEEMKMREKN